MRTKKKIATFKFLRALNKRSAGTVLNEGGYQITTKDGEKIILKRIGKCSTEKCDALCCKIMTYDIDNMKYPNYVKGFADEIKDGIAIIYKKCKQCIQNKCRIFGPLARTAGAFPIQCDQFPVPTDSTYHAVMHVCNFKFEIIDNEKANKKLSETCKKIHR